MSTEPIDIRGFRRLPLLRITGDRPRVPPSDSQVLAQIAGQLGKIALILREGFRYNGGVNSDPMRSGESVPAPVLSKIGPAARGISEAVDAWVLAMAGKGKRDRTIHVFRRKVEECARSCGWVTVADAALYIAFLALTGLRDGEATAIRWRDVDLTGEPPALYTCPTWAKNRRKMRVCLNDEIRGLLAAHHARTGGTPDERVFASKPNQRTFHIIREAAGVQRRDGRGRVASFHSLRKLFATALDGTGATPGVVSRLTRHAKDLTQRKYIDPDWRAELAAVSALPRPWESGDERILKSGLAIAERYVTVLPVAAKHAESPMVANPYNHESDTVGRPPASASLAANSDHQGRSSASDSSSGSTSSIKHDNGPSRSRLPDFDRADLAALVEAQAAQLTHLARLIRAGGGA